VTDHNPAGFPRPVHPRLGKNTPMPWVGGEKPYEGRWAGIDLHRAEDAGNQGLCIICGERVGPDWLYALLSGRPFDRRSNAFDIFFGVGSPSPTFGHPKCVLIAATFCPHLRRQEHPAQTQDGRKLTHEELKELAHRKVPA
jgi:hypothetical protein